MHDRAVRHQQCEAEADRRLSEVLVKQLTGGDRITARFLFREFFEFTPAFKLFLACNHKPVIAGTDYAIWRRIRLIPFDVTIPREEQDKKLPAKLREELPGVLTWLVRGCLDWQRDGLTEPTEVLDATQAYREEMDILGGFLTERCILGPRYKAPAADLYNAYKTHCEANGEEPIKQTTFGMRLSERGIIVRREGSGKKVRVGIGLLTNNQSPPTQSTCEEKPNSSNSISGTPITRDASDKSYPDNCSNCSNCSKGAPSMCGNDPPQLDPLRQRVYDLAGHLGFPEVGVFQEATGPGVEAWCAWLQGTSEGRVKTMMAVLDGMIRTRKGGDT